MCTGPCIALCMGEKGQPTRVLAAKFGAYLTFGALGGGKESAPGQPTLDHLQHMYRLPKLTAKCKVTLPWCGPTVHDAHHHHSLQ